MYDIELDDYMAFLCELSYTRIQMGVITRRPECNCTAANLDLNYPSSTTILETNYSSQVFKRILTNVRHYPSSYHAVINTPKGMTVTVEPQMLTFEGKDIKQEFWMKVEINLDNAAGAKTIEGDYIGNYEFLSWTEIAGKLVVRSPTVSAFAP